MDAPPGKEDVRPYLKVTRLLEKLGAHVPARAPGRYRSRAAVCSRTWAERIISRDSTRGEDPERLYGDALRVLAEIQVHGEDAAAELAPYDREALARELALMPEWFLRRHLELTLSDAESQTIARAFEFLIVAALAQPTVFVHRDFHSRNLMVVADRNPGIIDFQDALRGPVGYDLVSLLKDCYISWPRERVVKWVSGYRALLRSKGDAGAWLSGADDAEFLRWFDLIGVQRHVKVLGIFARLWYRDGKAGYLNDLPLTLEYVRDTCARYPELAEFSRFLESAGVLPRAREGCRGANERLVLLRRRDEADGVEGDGEGDGARCGAR
jgi:aminoglycoside/choline kinase family phosphotransferase